ncbi:MAG TPA: acyl carrier protein [Tissierellaceae bacterium]
MVFERVREIIAEQLGIEDIDSITMETSIMKDLEADSLDAVEIIMALEDEYGITIPDEDAEKFKNIGDIVRFIEESIA